MYRSNGGTQFNECFEFKGAEYVSAQVDDVIKNIYLNGYNKVKWYAHYVYCLFI